MTRYLSDFLASLQAQTLPHHLVEIVLVDDGSTDATYTELERWARTTDYRVKVLSRTNGGQAAARNDGLKFANGDWITFPDPDDILDPQYFEAVARLVESNPSANCDVLATNLITFVDSPDRPTDDHALRWRFRGGDRLVSLTDRPDFIHLSGGNSFIRRAAMLAEGVEFDTQVRPTFEDGHMIARILMNSANPLIGLVQSARYLYRRPAGQTSAVQTSWADPRRYTDVLEHGYHDLLLRAKAKFDHVPEWLQSTIIYETAWYLRADRIMGSGTAALSSTVVDEFWRWLQTIYDDVDADVIRKYSTSRIRHEERLVLLSLCVDDVHSELWAQPKVESRNNAQRLIQVTYYTKLDKSAERYIADGRLVEPIFQKTQSIVYIGRAVLHMRRVWLSYAGKLTMWLDGEMVPIGQHGRISRQPYALDLPRLEPSLDTLPGVTEVLEGAELLTPMRRLLAAAKWRFRKSRRIVARAGGSISRRIGDIPRRYTVWSSTQPRVKSRYKDAWLLMDRLEQAHDNAEHLYRYLAVHRPDINAYFILSQSSPDWHRLSAEGFKLIAHGSSEHAKAMMNASEVVASDVVLNVYGQFNRRRYPGQKWRLTFLQHGITKDDLSVWLNSKPISTLITATPAEHEAFVADGTPYKFTNREVVLTGFPRHDRLVRLAHERDKSGRGIERSVMIVPTWRRALGLEIERAVDRVQAHEIFATSFFWQSWLELMNDPGLREACHAGGRKIIFVPHPNMQKFISDDAVPEHVELLRYSEMDIQRELVAAEVVVTDYSSLATEGALVGAAAVYFQFDREAFRGDGHVYRQGYFNYESDGYGPVVDSSREASAAIIRALTGGEPRLAEFRARAASDFAEVSGSSCQKVVEAVESGRRDARLR